MNLNCVNFYLNNRNTDREWYAGIKWIKGGGRVRVTYLLFNTATEECLESGNS